MFTVLVIVLLLDALICVVSILLQAGQGGGLASLGGGAGTEMLMGGRQAATILHKITWWTAGIFLFLALVMAFMSTSGTGPRSALQNLPQQPQPVQPAPLPIQSAPAPTKTPTPTTPRPTPNR
jgi:preprotein translocase subunit SecG